MSLHIYIKPTKCDVCNCEILDYSDDGDKTCQCVSCKNYLWNHDDINKKCYCILYPTDKNIKSNAKYLKIFCLRQSLK